MLFLVLGKGKTGSLVAEVARERGHGVRVLDLRENRGAASITAPTLAGVDAVIDFTNAESAVQNIRAVMALGGKIVVGTTGWYASLDELRSKTSRGGSLLYGANFSIGVQKLFRLTAELAKLDGYTFSIRETHHTTKLDAPSGTAVTLQEIVSAAHPGVEIPITSHREGDASGEHVVTAKSDVDLIEVRHDASSRRGFALGAVRAAEWLAHQKSGAWNFRDIFEQL
ncbi:4-hydroxy-tetrahydrodipicolinate reductase [Terracidiphilus gabretensis]|uniref:4-hydroxy-tetrahydrodipicolinate reductase n=1 Tax=Terracidiphilus gabretensis TaxID=1577687 RepID=UPI00071BC197|nr:dihydrodipicolinate reductase C-terminal domain-containing protein [Terracidiphilus gabretensis]